MNTDIRILTSFKNHRKRKRLAMILGHDGTGYLIDLWLTVATDCPSGTLTGWDELDIAIATGWEGDPKVIVDALIKARFIERDNGVFIVHDWVANNGYASSAEARSEKARKAAEAKWGAAKRAKEEKKDDASLCSEQCYKHDLALPESENSNAPSPSPSPSPSPKTLSAKTRNSYDEDFEKVSSTYPKKSGSKKAAYDAWKKLNGSRPPVETLLEAIQAQIEWRQRAGPNDFRPLWKDLERWIKGRMWEAVLDDPNSGEDELERWARERDARDAQEGVTA